MNVPMLFQLFGNPVLTEDQAREIRANLAAEESFMASLDAEIAQAVAQLEELKKQREAAQRVLFSGYGAPSGLQVMEISRNIEEKEKELERYQADIAQTDEALRFMLDKRQQIWNEDERASLDVHIAHCRKALENLKRGRDDIQTTLEQQRALLSPIRRLPLEILSEIFLYVLPNTHHNDDNVQAKPTDAPLLLIQVCSSWMHLAYSIPHLWSSLSITIQPNKCQPHPDLVHAWRERSLSSPLSFHIDERLPNIEETDPDTQIVAADLLKIYAPAYSRWQRVKLDYGDWRYPSGLTSLPVSSPPPLLETLGVSRDFYPAEERPILSMLFSAPKLQSFSWSCRDPILRPTSVLPMSQLTNLSLSDLLTANIFFTVLRDCPSLVSGHFSVVQAFGHPDSLGERLEIPPLENLSTLSLKIDSRLCDVFERLTLPALKHLSLKKTSDLFLLDNPAAGRLWSQEEFFRLQRRSRFELETFDLSDVDIRAEELLDVVRATDSQSLKHLILASERVRTYPVTDDVLRALTRVPVEDGEECDHRVGRLCPYLETLKFWGSVSSTDGVLADMIESMWLPTTPIPGVDKLKMMMVMVEDRGRHTKDIKKAEELNAKRRGVTIMSRP